MLKKLLPLLGKSLESPEIRSLFDEWAVAPPKKSTCTANNDTVKTGLKKDGLILQFGRGGHSRFKKPIPAKAKNSFVGMLNLIEITPKFGGELPFPISPKLDPAELIRVLGEPKTVDFMGKTQTWRRAFDEKYELIASIWESPDGMKTESLTVNFLWEADLFLMEDYAARGL